VSRRKCRENIEKSIICEFYIEIWTIKWFLAKIGKIFRK
jgi:hypothetical protein